MTASMTCIAVLLSIVGGLFVQQAKAWGAEGHRIVANVAYQQLSHDSRAEVVAFANTPRPLEVPQLESKLMAEPTDCLRHSVPVASLGSGSAQHRIGRIDAASFDASDFLTLRGHPLQVLWMRQEDQLSPRKLNLLPR